MHPCLVVLQNFGDASAPPSPDVNPPMLESHDVVYRVQRDSDLQHVGASSGEVMHRRMKASTAAQPLIPLAVVLKRAVTFIEIMYLRRMEIFIISF